MHQRKNQPAAHSLKQQPLMAKPSLLSRHHRIALLVFLILSLAAVLACMSRSFTLCPSSFSPAPLPAHRQYSQPNGLEVINGKLVILVSHELSLSGGPLLLMELAVLIKRAGGHVKWITNQRDAEKAFISRNLESKLLKNGIQAMNFSSINSGWLR